MNPLLAHTPLCCISFLILLKIKCIEKKININNQIITIFVFIFWVVFILGPSLFFGLSLFYRLHSIIGWSSFLGCLHFWGYLHFCCCLRFGVIFIYDIVFFLRPSLFFWSFTRLRISSKIVLIVVDFCHYCTK